MSGFFGFVTMCAQHIYQSFIHPVQTICRAYLGDGLYTYMSARVQDIVFYNLFSI